MRVRSRKEFSSSSNLKFFTVLMLVGCIDLENLLRTCGSLTILTDSFDFDNFVLSLESYKGRSHYMLKLSKKFETSFGSDRFNSKSKGWISSNKFYIPLNSILSLSIGLLHTSSMEEAAQLI